MILIYDTETSGLPKKKYAPSSDVDNWPHIVQIAMLLKYDIGSQPLAKISLIVKPEGYEISEGATAIHGITTERAIAEGVSLPYALGYFWALQNMARYLVAHNAEFDGKVVRAACHRAGINEHLTMIPTLDTMKLTTYFCNLPPAKGKKEPKWPKLEELHEKLFGFKHDNAHDAMGDVEATDRCLEELYLRGVINEQSLRDADAQQEKINQMVIAKAAREAAL